MKTIYRYRGKQLPDAVLAEICWWSKNVFEDEEEEEGGVSERETEILVDSDADTDDDSDGIDDFPLQLAPKRVRAT